MKAKHRTSNIEHRTLNAGVQGSGFKVQGSRFSCPQPLLLAGTTAVGKSDVALLLAEQLDGEIISVDSMQVYRGLDIGTAKPSPVERARVPHHLIDVVDVTEPFDAAKFADLAHRAAEEIQSRGRVPILCGGTGLYFKAFLEGLGDTPPADAPLRAQLEATPLADLLSELKERDPATFERIDRQNPRRVIRAVEVIRLTGKPFSAQRAEWKSASSIQHPASFFLGLTRSSADLRARIDTRVEQMFQRGLVEETRQLLERGLAQNKTAMQAIGYRQVVEHLRGERSLAETIELVKIRTRQLAKRQMTWFRRQAKLNWVEIAPTDQPAAVTAQIYQLILPHAKDAKDVK
jgi:tRNA dimethylallyltransferase